MLSGVYTCTLQFSSLGIRFEESFQTDPYNLLIDGLHFERSCVISTLRDECGYRSHIDGQSHAVVFNDFAVARADQKSCWHGSLHASACCTRHVLVLQGISRKPAFAELTARGP